MLPFAELPDSGWFPILSVGIGILALVGVAIVLGFLQKFRKSLAAELRNELATSDKPAKREIQTPLVVAEAVEFATKKEHDGLRKEFVDFRDEVRVSFDEAAGTSRQSREKIYNELRRQGEFLAANTKQTELTSQQVSNLDRKIDRILERQADK